MTAVKFHTQGSRITGFDCAGHAGFDDAGSDIVCAAVTSAIRLTECAINEVGGIGAPVKVSKKTGRITLTVPEGLNPESEALCQTILASLMVYFSELCEEYPDNIEVLEG